jgi:hypothetical protein
MSTVLLLLCLVAGALASGFPSFSDFQGEKYSVTYNNRSVLLNGEPALFLSGSVHPPRSTPAMWPGIFSQMRENGLNMVEVYVMWCVSRAFGSW